MSALRASSRLSCNCICKDHRNEIEAPDPVVKDLISYKIMKRLDKKARLINGTETTIFVKYPILRKAQPLFFRVLQIITSKAKKLFTFLLSILNIPYNEGINACQHFLDTRNHNTSTVRTETLCDLIRMILTMDNFSFNDKHYPQVHGTAMGTRMAPSHSNLFRAKFETNALSRAPYQPHTHGGIT